MYRALGHRAQDDFGDNDDGKQLGRFGVGFDVPQESRTLSSVEVWFGSKPYVLQGQHVKTLHRSVE